MGTPVRNPCDGRSWTDPGPSGVAAALAELATRYTVVSDRPVARCTTWLDTPDFRLYRRGMSLTVSTGPGGQEGGLELRSPHGPTVTASPDTLGWPRLLACLPHQLRPHLEPVVGARALLPVAQVSGTSVAGTLLDAEGKTVARFVHEHPAEIDGGRGRLPGALRLSPLRGYARVGTCADRAARRAGLSGQEAAGYPAVLGAAGLDPLAPRPVLEPGLPARVAVARLLLSFLDEVEAAWDGTVSDVDVEFLHELRVAVRRSRSAVKLLGGVLPPALVGWVAPQLAWLGDLTTPARDLDVLLQTLPVLTDRLVGARPEDLEPLVLDLLRLRSDEQLRLVRGLRSVRAERFRARWRGALAEVASWDGRPCGGATAGAVAADRLAVAERRVLRRGGRITDDSPAGDLHDLRKRAKELRYLLETALPATGAADGRGALAELKALQDVLGTFQDSEAQRLALHARAVVLMANGGVPARTVLAMGELAAQLQLDQDSSRARFASAFQRFASAFERFARRRVP